MKNLNYIFIFFVSTVWLVAPSPVLPLGLIFSYLYSRRFEFRKTILFPIILLGTSLGYFGQGFYLKLDEGKFLFGVNFDLEIREWTSSKESVARIEWGEAASEILFLNRKFDLVGSYGPENSGEFPIIVQVTSDFKSRFDVEMLFEEDHFSMSVTCSHFDGQDYLVDEAYVTASAEAVRTGSSYEILEQVSEEISMERQPCGMEIAPGSYSVRIKGKELRVYLTDYPDYYFTSTVN